MEVQPCDFRNLARTAQEVMRIKEGGRCDVVWEEQAAAQYGGSTQVPSPHRGLRPTCSWRCGHLSYIPFSCSHGDSFFTEFRQHAVLDHSHRLRANAGIPLRHGQVLRQ